MDRRLVVFTRYPMPGRAKTRLIPALGPVGAAVLQREMAAAAVATLRPLAGPQCRIEVRYAGGGARRMRRWLGPGLRYAAQGGGDLGERMARGFAAAFQDGCRRVVIVGTDCPQMTADDVQAAFDALADCDLVLGPSTDGGYWLIGLRDARSGRAGVPALFHGVPWSTAAAMQGTLANARRLGLSVRLAAERTDLDEPADLTRLMPGALARPPWISVIVPALNEAGHIAATLATARSDGVEVLVVDGGSDDGTADIAARCGAGVLAGVRGRAAQQNLGAARARGEVLLFLHADTRLPARWVDHVFDALADPRAVGGAFAFRTDFSRPAMWLIERLVNLRSRCLHMPYGDQAVFVRREVFEALGGFPDAPIAEDLLFMRQLARRGRIAIAAAPAVTSGRRWRRLGPLRTTWINQRIVLGLRLGVPIDRLARLY